MEMKGHDYRKRRKGFTLIELLVVIAIIAILAAILFPVFAQARASARKTSCLSNHKQATTARLMHAQDYDETTPIYFEGSIGGTYLITEPQFLIQPYIKNKDVLFCPDRSEKHVNTAGMTTAGASPGDKVRGLAYNWGPILCSDDRGGLLGPMVMLPGSIIMYPGVALAAIVAPAETFALGDSYGKDIYTMTIDHGLRGFTASRNSSLNHGSGFNTSFMDGHAKNVGWRAGILSHGTAGFWIPTNRIGMPRNSADWSKWCADPEKPVTTWGGQTVPCKQVASYVNSLNPAWFTD
jgi:prepilin-type N-terminal cleavage/methylation domain-containing protein/prepilin-type processing-associated H-X9-DG protein